MPIRPGDVHSDPDPVHQVLLNPVEERATIDVDRRHARQVEDRGVNPDLSSAPVATAGAGAQHEGMSDGPVFDDERAFAALDSPALPGGDSESPVVAGERIAQRQTNGRSALLLVEFPDHVTEVATEGVFSLVEFPGERIKRLFHRKNRGRNFHSFSKKAG